MATNVSANVKNSSLKISDPLRDFINRVQLPIMPLGERISNINIVLKVRYKTKWCLYCVSSSKEVMVGFEISTPFWVRRMAPTTTVAGWSKYAVNSFDFGLREKLSLDQEYIDAISVAMHHLIAVKGR